MIPAKEYYRQRREHLEKLWDDCHKAERENPKIREQKAHWSGVRKRVISAQRSTLDTIEEAEKRATKKAAALAFISAAASIAASLMLHRLFSDRPPLHQAGK